MCLAAASANPMLHRSTKNRREVIVDGNGFYLGGGANNNLREASQIYDIGGPIVNPWINAFTQPIERIGTAQRMGAFGLGGYAPIALGLGAGGIGAGGIAGGIVPPVAVPAIVQPQHQQTTLTTTGGSNIDLNALAQLVAQLAAQQNQQQQQQQVQIQQQPAQVIQTTVHQEAPGKLQPFTAVFLNNGQPPLFKVGLPSDFSTGVYTTI
jgi:hypothetical protein